MRTPGKIIFYVLLYSIAMGFMESAVVIYLREILYPEGFSFPLVPIPHRLAAVEILREAATVIMLVTVAYLAGRSNLQRFAFFCVAFAVWDLVYYLFLYIFLGWPASLFTWDILFLIPVPWVGPVWAPCLISLLMLTGGLGIVYRSESDPNHTVGKLNWLLLLTGAIICIVSFMMDFFRATRSALEDSVLSSGDLFTGVQTYVPGKFDVTVFFTGFFMMVAAVVRHFLGPPIIPKHRHNFNNE